MMMLTIKMRFPALTLILVVVLWTNQTAAAAFTVQDTALQQCLQALAQSKQWLQPEDVKEIDCHNNDIRSLVGLEQFRNLQTLSLYNNKLTEVDINLGQFQYLNTLNLARNHLVKLDLVNMPSLESLYLFANRINRLQLIDLSGLTILKTHNNVIESFRYANTPKLKKIYIFNNKLETIDIYNLPALQYMDCRENPMPDELYDEMDRLEGKTFLHDGNAEDW